VILPLTEIFEKENRKKKVRHVHWNQAIVDNDDFAFHIVLGSCVSVVLCGLDESGKVWIGANHLFKARDKNDDMALQHVAELYNNIKEKITSDVYCLGVFGAAYRKNSMAREVATKNIKTILEALDLFNLKIELFQTGYSQGLTIIRSYEADAFLIKHHDIKSKETRIIEIPLLQIFHELR
jgi:chemotaxis receptor (MCP) glutamine deamidase CheD